MYHGGITQPMTARRCAPSAPHLSPLTETHLLYLGRTTQEIERVVYDVHKIYEESNIIYIYIILREYERSYYYSTLASRVVGVDLLLPESRATPASIMHYIYIYIYNMHSVL